MPSGATIDVVGRPATDEEVASRLGFTNVHAFYDWSNMRKRSADDQLNFVLSEICNLREQIKVLEARLTSTGTERIG